MKLTSFVLIGLCCAFGRVLAEVDTLWTRAIPVVNTTYSEIYSATAAADGDYLLCGQSYGDGPNGQDYFLGRTNSLGNVEWTGVFGSEDVETAWSVIELDNSVLITAGTDYWNDGQSYGLRISAHAASGDSLWSITRDSIEPYGTYGMCKLADGNFVVVASMYTQTFERDICLFKFNPQGGEIWSRTFNLGAYEYGRRVIESADGTLLIAGEIQPDSLDTSRAFLMRTTALGAELWTQYYARVDDWGVTVSGLAENNVGDIFLSGASWGVWWFNSAFVFKIDADGEQIWEAQNLSFIGFDAAGIAPDGFGGCLAAGTQWPDFGFPIGLIVEINADGDTVSSWQTPVWNSGFFGITEASPTGWFAYGFISDENFNRSGYLARIGSPTVLQGRVTHSLNAAPVAGVRVTVTEDGAFDITDSQGNYHVVSGVTLSDVEIDHPCITPRVIEDLEMTSGEVNMLDVSVGIPQYARQPSSVNLAIRYDVPETATVTLSNAGSGDLTYTAAPEVSVPSYNWLSVTPTSGIVTTGNSVQLTVTLLADPEQGNDGEFFGFIRVRNHSCPDSVDLIPISAIVLDAEDPPAGAVRDFALRPAFPNPFNGETQLRFALPSPERVRLDLYDVTGRFIRSLLQRDYAAGTHTYRLTLNDSPSGVYLVNLRAGTFTASQKIVLIK